MPVVAKEHRGPHLGIKEQNKHNRAYIVSPKETRDSSQFLLNFFKPNFRTVSNIVWVVKECQSNLGLLYFPYNCFPKPTNDMSDRYFDICSKWNFEGKTSELL